MFGISIVGGLVILMGLALLGSTFFPDDALIAIPIPKGAGRNLVRAGGIFIIALGAAIPAIGYNIPALHPPTTTPTATPSPSATATLTVTVPPTIAQVPTVTPIPPTPTITPTRGTQAPIQSLQNDVIRVVN